MKREQMVTYLFGHTFYFHYTFDEIRTCPSYLSHACTKYSIHIIIYSTENIIAAIRLYNHALPWLMVSNTIFDYIYGVQLYPINRTQFIIIRMFDKDRNYEYSRQKSSTEK